MFQKLKNIFHLFQAVAANIWYGFPSRSIKVIGVTGTDGKTTSTHLIYHILKNCGKRVSMISTIYAQVGTKIFDTGFHTTTPNSFQIQKLLRLAVDNKDDYFVLETTSHRLDQNSLWGVFFEVSLITNITHEHLDYHKTYEKYLETKVKIINLSKISLLNRDDESYPLILKRIKKQIIKTYSLKEKSDFSVDYKQIYSYITKYNSYNYLGAHSVCEILGLSKDKIIRSLIDFKLPKGRLEVVYDGEYKIIVDFAHTPNAISEVLKSVRNKYFIDKQRGKLIHIFGSAGLRDSSKRYFMGCASGTYSDIVILTEEDYRNENPYKICEQIADGLQEKSFTIKESNLIEQNDKKKYTIMIKRNEAITKAISLALPGDVLVITGKGHEMSICRGKREFPWNDIDYVKKIKFIS